MNDMNGRHPLENPKPSSPSRARALVFEDPASVALLDQIARLAPSDATILVTGETGTGKEIVARNVHDRSRRPSGPFVAVNCGALTPSLIESELFGHERGAFTGALQARAGYFESAAGGTLFLDEIGELPTSAQVSLLRVLQEREVVRVGSRTPIPIDVRVIAATHRDLHESVRTDRFREDLYYRLAVAEIAIPPLRERRGDILPLARYFLERYARTLAIQGLRFSTDAEQRLIENDWPGNIRELENAVHHAILVRCSPVITAAELPSRGARRLRLAPFAAETPGALDARSALPEKPDVLLERALAALVDAGVTDLHQHVENVLFRTTFELSGRNQLRTARTLGVSRNIVRARLIEHGLLSSVPRPVVLERAPQRLRFGYQKLGLLTEPLRLGANEMRLAATDTLVEWIELGSGMQIMESLERDEIDVGIVGEAPPVFAQAAGIPFVYLAADPPAPDAQAIVVRRDSSIRSVADLRGRTIAMSRGSSAVYFVVRALEEAGLGLGDVEMVTLLPSAARSAFARGQIDAWAIWEPVLSVAREELGAITLRDARGLAAHRTFYVARSSYAEEHPSTLELLLRELEALGTGAQHERAVPLQREAIVDQQRIADTLHRQRLVARRVEVGDAVWDRHPPKTRRLA